MLALQHCEAEWLLLQPAWLENDVRHSGGEISPPPLPSPSLSSLRANTALAIDAMERGERGKGRGARGSGRGGSKSSGDGSWTWGAVSALSRGGNWRTRGRGRGRGGHSIAPML